MTNDWQKKWSDSNVSSDSSNCAKTNHFRLVSIRFYRIRRVGLHRHVVLTTFLAVFLLILGSFSQLLTVFISLFSNCAMTNNWQKKLSDLKVLPDSSNCAKTNHFRRVSIRFYTIRRIGLVRHVVLTTFLAYFFY